MTFATFTSPATSPVILRAPAVGKATTGKAVHVWSGTLVLDFAVKSSIKHNIERQLEPLKTNMEPAKM